MAERSLPHAWGMRALFVLLALVIMFFHLLPLNLAAVRYAPPDLLFALAMAWSFRRPDHVPALMLAAVLVLADLLFQRPPGLWAAMVLVACEWAKARGDRRQEETGFVVEWVRVAMLIVILTVVYRLVLTTTITEPGPLALAAMQAMFTILIYPLVVAVSHFIFGVRRIGPGDIESYG